MHKTSLKVSKKLATNERYRLVRTSTAFPLQILSLTTDRYGKKQRLLLQLRWDQVFQLFLSYCLVRCCII